jgi:DNA-directed RNA polymerase
MTFLEDWNPRLPIDSSKHEHAFAPNFVHSLDATHMMLTALKCAERGIPFAAVHDSYWCPASDVDTMREIRAATFQEVHREPRLDVLYRELQRQYPTLKFDAPPLIGGTTLTGLIPLSPYF